MKLEKDRNPWRRRRKSALVLLGIQKDRLIKAKKEILEKLKGSKKSKDLKALLKIIDFKEKRITTEIATVEHKILRYSHKNS